jgi:hypothetical protein
MIPIQPLWNFFQTFGFVIVMPDEYLSTMHHMRDTARSCVRSECEDLGERIKQSAVSIHIESEILQGLKNAIQDEVTMNTTLSLDSIEKIADHRLSQIKREVTERINTSTEISRRIQKSLDR